MSKGKKQDAPVQREIPAENSILLYFHCGVCLKMIPDGIAPKDWTELEVGWTELGLQVVCKRCGRNVVHIDFEKQKHPANTTATALGEKR